MLWRNITPALAQLLVFVSVTTRALTLPSAASDWFKKRPEEPAAVAKRITEFRQGCSMLILAKHAPLSPEDRQWLVERCRLWARKLDDHLVALEA